MIILLTKFKVKRTDTRTTPIASKELNKEGGILSLFLIFSTIRALILSSNFNPFRANASVYFNAFQCSVTFLYPLKTSENFWFSDVFRGYKKCYRILECIDLNGNIDTSMCHKYIKIIKFIWKGIKKAISI